MRRRAAVEGAASALLGALLGWGVVHVVSARADRRAPATIPAPTPASGVALRAQLLDRNCPPVLPPDPEVGPLVARMEELDLRTRILRAQRDRREGVVQAWPTEVDELLRPEVLEARFRAALQQTGFGVLHDVDCVEYPCVITLLTGRPPTSTGSSLGPFRPILEALDGLGYEDYELAVATALNLGDDEVAVLAVKPPDGAYDPTRTRHRADEAIRALHDLGDMVGDANGERTRGGGR